jgi:hypothetical protein
MFGKKTNQQAVADHKTAVKNLHANQRAEKKAGIREETDTYVALNARVNETEKNVPWYRR